jgi:hypothetical protein
MKFHDVPIGEYFEFNGFEFECLKVSPRKCLYRTTYPHKGEWHEIQVGSINVEVDPATVDQEQS